MENEIKKLKKIYLETKPTKFLEEQGVSNVWEKVDRSKPKYMVFPRYLVIAVVVLMGFAGFIGATYAATSGSVLYEVKKITQQVARHVPIVNSVVPQDLIPSPAPTHTLPTSIPTPSIMEINDEGEPNSEIGEVHKEEMQEKKEDKHEDDVKGEKTQENEYYEGKKVSEKSSPQEEEESEHKDEEEDESESKNQKDE